MERTLFTELKIYSVWYFQGRVKRGWKVWPLKRALRRNGFQRVATQKASFKTLKLICRHNAVPHFHEIGQATFSALIFVLEKLLLILEIPLNPSLPLLWNSAPLLK